MSLTDLRRLWPVARRCFPGAAPKHLKLTAAMLAEGARQGAAAGRFLDPAPGTMLARVMAQRPETLGALVWPYQCAAWPAGTRLERIAGHYAAIDRLGGPLVFDLDQKLVLADLGDMHDGLRVVIDQPKWFMREGGLVVNLFVGSFRAFSLAFSLWPAADGRLVAVVGGLQGRNRDDALDLYRQLTKDLHGMRPRDFLFDVFRMLCRRMGVDGIEAVTQAMRHHNHPYFGEKETLTPDYDAIWEDRGGQRTGPDFYRLAVDPEVRDLDTVKPKKRSLYRKRFAFLDAFEADLPDRLDRAAPVRFTDT